MILLCYDKSCVCCILIIMRFLKAIKTVVLSCDLFKTTQYFRCKGQPEYRTLTGGVCSIFIIILFIGVFYGSVLSTINRDRLNWGYDLVSSTTDFFNITCTSKKDSKFMFAVGINNLDMNTGERYFDLKLSQFTKKDGITTEIEVGLVPCDRDVWQGANGQILQIYDRYNFNSFLCPQENEQFTIAGSASSVQYKYIKISAMKCNASLSLRPCASDLTLSNFLLNNQNFFLNIYFINGLINPSNAQEITYYLEDRNSVPFNLVYGGSLNIYMSKYKIQTDESITPFSDTRTLNGGIVGFVGQYLATNTFHNIYASIYIRKSHLSYEISRQYTKMDTTLSYIGGLFGFLMIAFYLMQVYTEYSFQIQMGDTLYFYDSKTPLNSKKFHFLTFLLYLVYSFFKNIGIEMPIILMNRFEQCRQEIKKQFDFSFLMKRIIFFQRSLRILFEDHQFKGLHMHEKLTLKEAQELRSYYRLREKINQNAQGNQSIQQNGHSQQNEQDKGKVEELNETQNILQHNEQLIDIKSQQAKFKSNNKIVNSYTRKVYPQEQKNGPNKSQANSSDIMLNMAVGQKIQKSIQSTRKVNKTERSKKQFKKEIKILRKESEKGNVVSKRIFEGVDSQLIKKILLKIQENAQKEDRQSDEVLICENKDDFEIRISKRNNNQIPERSTNKKDEPIEIEQQKCLSEQKKEKEYEDNPNGLRIQQQQQFTVQRQQQNKKQSIVSSFQTKKQPFQFIP